MTNNVTYFDILTKISSTTKPVLPPLLILFPSNNSIHIADSLRSRQISWEPMKVSKRKLGDTIHRRTLLFPSLTIHFLWLGPGKLIFTEQYQTQRLICTTSPDSGTVRYLCNSAPKRGHNNLAQRRTKSDLNGTIFSAFGVV